MVKFADLGVQTVYGAGTTGGGTADIPNVGITRLMATTAETYALAPPVAGARKIIMHGNATTHTHVVRGATGATVTFNAAGATQITFPGTLDDCGVELVGLSSVRWHVVGLHPCTTVANTPIFAST